MQHLPQVQPRQLGQAAAAWAIRALSTPQTGCRGAAARQVEHSGGVESGGRWLEAP